MELIKARKQKVKIKIGLQGSAGSGKTYSALKIAMGMVDGDVSRIAVIDTENGSASLYSDIFGEFLTLPLEPPYSPERCVEAVNLCAKTEGVEVIIFDSISHEWMGVGGVMDLIDSMSGQGMQKWAKMTPRHNKFIDSILQVDKHVICTMRSKQDYVLTENEKGKMVPEKVGMKAVTRDGVDYEFTLNFDLDQSNFAHTNKDRTSLFKNKPEFRIEEATGRTILEWCNSGIDVVLLGTKALEDCSTLEHLQNVWGSYKNLQSNELFMKTKDEMKISIQFDIEQNKAISDQNKLTED